LDGEACVLYGGEAVYSHGRIIGYVRSGGYGYTIAKNIAYVYLPLELATAGTEVEIESFGQRIPAEVAVGPLYDPKGTRLRS
jgi:glycine cleavage system aminomethyltransferase T